jgi:2-dehydro-3-deoxygluconokinase
VLTLRPKSDCRYDIVSLGEVMLRFDPGNDRIHTARSFQVWEGGGEYNVARNMAKCFNQRAAIVTALADNQIGRLVEDLMLQGGMDVSNVIWRETDGISRTVRNGMYFMERGFGMRPPTGSSDRGNTAVSQLRPGDIDWKNIFGRTRWFHTGGIFAGLSESTAEVAGEAMRAAKDSGAIVSYDLNYRESLWSGRGGRDAANELNHQLLEHADIVFGVENFKSGLGEYSRDSFETAAREMIARHPNMKFISSTLREVRSASSHDLSGVCYSAISGETTKARDYKNAEVLDRVGSGDAFAAGFIYSLISSDFQDTTKAIELAAASAVLSLASLGDGSSATLAEIERLVSASGQSAVR